jgi:hypothetical protein
VPISGTWRSLLPAPIPPCSLTHALTYSTLTLTYAFRSCLATVPHAAREKERADVYLPPFPAMLMVIVMHALVLLVGRCAPTHLVLTTDPQLAGIRAVYVPLFDSLDPHPEAAMVRTAALKAQLKADGVFQVVEDPQFADAYFKGTVGKWMWGGLDWQGARSSEVSGSLRLLDATHQPLWVAAAVQRDPLRVVAHGLFARPPGLLAPHWARTVLHQIPGYAVAGRSHPRTSRERRPSPPES